MGTVIVAWIVAVGVISIHLAKRRLSNKALLKKKLAYLDDRTAEITKVYYRGD